MRLAFGLLTTLVLATGALAQTASGQNEAPVTGDELSQILGRLQVSLDIRPIRSEGQLCQQYRGKGYATEEACRDEARKYVSAAIAGYLVGRRAEAEKKAAEVARAGDADSAALSPFSLTDDALNKAAGPESFSVFGGPSVRQRLIASHQRAVEPFVNGVVAKVEKRIIREYDDAGLSNEALQEANSQCTPWVFLSCWGPCPRPLDNLPREAWSRLKGVCEAKKREVKPRRCKAAAEAADPDGAFDDQRFAVHGNQGRLADFNFPGLVCSAGMEGVQVRLRQSGWIFKKRWVEFGAVGEGDTIAIGNLETVKRPDGVEVQLIKSLDRKVAAFAGPEDLVPCLNINAGSEEMQAMRDAALGGILVGLGVAEGGGSLFDAFLRAGKIDKCRADIGTFVKQ
ncbi:MAG TPA: hypothetical protein VGO06_04325 [Bosea sp. (in: a-proteobacteria)]|uniref:hypothetical protein n=1 Tax=Bosea sp. (in: a-proteobacteria) TaxID=1871050 RepID=UPI002E14A47B|nr:hypothetical protein [Bosea sp. (in: a-proteobacteria)]